MSTLTSVVIPVKDETTGVITEQSFDLGGSGTSKPEKIGIGYGVCNTASATLAKTATISGFTLTKNGIVAIKFDEDVPASSTLNISSTGAKPMFYRGAAIASNVIHAGDTVIFVYDGTNFNATSIDKFFRASVEITGDANTTIQVTNNSAGIEDYVTLNPEGKGTYIVNIPGTYVFDIDNT